MFLFTALQSKRQNGVSRKHIHLDFTSVLAVWVDNELRFGGGPISAAAHRWCFQFCFENWNWAHISTNIAQVCSFERLQNLLKNPRGARSGPRRIGYAAKMPKSLNLWAYPRSWMFETLWSFCKSDPWKNSSGAPIWIICASEGTKRVIPEKNIVEVSRSELFSELWKALRGGWKTRTQASDQFVLQCLKVICFPT